MTQRYSHLAERVLVEAVQALPGLPENGNGGVVSETLSLGGKNPAAALPG